MSTNCGPCLERLPSLARWHESLAEKLTLAAIFSGTRDEIERVAAEHGLGIVLAQPEDETFQLYALRATPSAVIVDRDGLIASAPAEGVAAIEALIRATLAEDGRPALSIQHA
jgi:thiol-disulfide isomerase/thioredoxin